MGAKDVITLQCIGAGLIIGIHLRPWKGSVAIGSLSKTINDNFKDSGDTCQCNEDAEWVKQKGFHFDCVLSFLLECDIRARVVFRLVAIESNTKSLAMVATAVDIPSLV